jgi:mRNA interferase RelE/StbE
VALKVTYHPDIGNDLAGIAEPLKGRIRKAIEERLAKAPERYGEPLRRTLKGYWKMRVGDYRTVFEPSSESVLVLAIRHRKEVYRILEKRRGQP